MKKVPKISESEWRVMQVLWAHSPQTANEVVECLDGHVTWSPRTIKTLLNRLVKKGGLGYTPDGRKYLYRPLVEEQTAVRAERRSFLRRLYGGALSPMLSQFIEDEPLTRDEIDRLQSLLEEKRRESS